MSIILYSTNCPKCHVLEMKLKQKNIPFKINTDADEMIKLGFSEAPILKVDDKYLGFSEANKYINSL